jgi:hypothetical protein
MNRGISYLVYFDCQIESSTCMQHITLAETLQSLDSAEYIFSVAI